jgi:membrane-associated protease RseP (regulator of RpoE activity)
MRSKPLVSRGHLVAIILVTSLVLLVAGWFVNAPATVREGAFAPRLTLQSILTHPLDFAKSHVTGGVGGLLGVDPRTGMPMVQGVGMGSPAEKAGLKSGDVIACVDGQSLAGVSIPDVADNIRGLAAAKVVLTIMRRGKAQSFDCVIRRASWNSMRSLTFNSFNSMVTYQFTGVGSWPPAAPPSVAPAPRLLPPQPLARP